MHIIETYTNYTATGYQARINQLIELCFLILLLLSPIALTAQNLDVEQQGIEVAHEEEQLLFSNLNDAYFHEELFLETTSSKLDKSTSTIRTYAFACDDGGWRICFEFPYAVTHNEKKEECLLCLEFNQSLSNIDLSKVQEALQFITNRFEYGYNTLVLHTTRPSTFCCYSEGNCFILDIYPDYCPPVPIPRLLKVARLRLLIEGRRFAPAFCALKQFLQEYPDDRDGWYLLGQLEGLLPRWQNAFAIYQEMKTRFPYSNSIQNALHDTFYPHSSFVRLERDYIRYIGQAAEQLWRASAEYIIRRSCTSYTYVGGDCEWHRGHLSLVTQSDGSTEGFLGDRVQGKLYLRNEFKNGSKIAATVYATEGVVMGAGIATGWLVPWIQGEVTFSLDWHKPYWDTYETFCKFGRQDRIYAESIIRCNRFFDGYLKGGVHRVGIEHIPNGWSSILLDCGSYWHFYFDGRNDASIHYDLNAEYVYDHAIRTDLNGNPFQPVPLSTFEFHTVTAEYVYSYFNWDLSLFGGYTINRLGSGGLNTGFNARYRKPCPCGWELAVSASQFPSTTNPGATEQMLNFELTLRY